MRWIFAIVAGLAFSVCLAQGVPTDEEGFVNAALARISKELPEYSIKPTGQLRLEGSRADGESTGQLHLDRVYAFCSRDSQNCGAALDQYARGIAESVKERNRPIDRSMVRLAIRPTEYVEQVRQQVSSKGGSIYAWPVTPGLQAIAVLDFTRSVRFVTSKDIEKLSVSGEDLRPLGELNIRSSTKPLAEVAPLPAANAFGYITDEDYASSRILFHSEWRDMSDKLHNNLVVMLPAPNVLLYGDGSTKAGLEALRLLAADVARQSTRPLPAIQLRWMETGWQEIK
ncbi:MAG: DUF1444 family protein [Rhodoferax sp.]